MDEERYERDDYQDDDRIYDQLVDQYIESHNGAWNGNGPLLEHLKECIGVIKNG